MQLFLLPFVAVLAAEAGPPSCSPGEQCFSLTSCPSTLQSMRLDPRYRPKPCGLQDSTTRVPDVCCPGGDAPLEDDACPKPAPPLAPTPDVTCEQFVNSLTDEDDSRPGNVARKMCRKHQEDLCALPLNRRGVTCPAMALLADILEFPHMALLGYGDRENIQYACGGSLIAPDFILTAAHCAFFSGMQLGWALLGATNRTGQLPKPTDVHQLIEVAEVIVHPEYVAPVKYHDVALVRLARPARVKSLEVYPACLDTDMDVDNTGRDAVATGWGATSFEDDGSQSLLKVNLTVRDMQYCRDNLKLYMEKVPRGFDDAIQLCAGGGEHNRDTCQGDSGGPLQMRANPKDRPCLFRIVGVVSFGPPCGIGKPHREKSLPVPGIG